MKFLLSLCLTALGLLAAAPAAFGEVAVKTSALNAELRDATRHAAIAESQDVFNADGVKVVSHQYFAAPAIPGDTL